MTLKGRQEPRVQVEPSRAYSDGDDAGILAASYGMKPDPWQQTILDAWLGRDESDKFTASRCGVLVPRQNGKNAIIEVRELYGTAILGEKILHTAHEVKTARKAFLRLASFFENEREYPELAALVVAIRRTNGQEAIVLNNGGSVEFSARSRGASRGFTVDVVVCDEAQELTDEQLEALMPTMAAAPLGNPQLILVGTPPNHNAAGEVFGRMRHNAHDGGDGKLSWHEWSVEEVGDIHDRQRWADCNPALGYRLNVSIIEDEIAQMSTDGFARERLSMWFENEAMRKPIDPKKWAKLATAKPERAGKTAYGVKFSPDGAVAALSVAVLGEGGKVHLEAIEHRSMSEGVGWLMDFLLPRWKAAATIVIDGLHWSGSLVEQLRANGVRNRQVITLPNSKDIVNASSMMLNAIEQETVTHFDQPGLNQSALDAVKREIGRGGGWAFGGEDSTLIESVTLAHFGALTSKRNPNRQQKLL